MLYINQVIGILYVREAHFRICISRLGTLYNYTKCHITTLEKIQRRAARFVCNNYSRYNSVIDMLNMLNWQSLEQRRNQAKSIMFYKTINNMVSVNFHQYLQPSVAITRGHHLWFIQLQARVDVYLHSFLPSTICLWNSLPANVVSSLTIDNFKNKLINTCTLYSA